MMKPSPITLVSSNSTLNFPMPIGVAAMPTTSLVKLRTRLPIIACMRKSQVNSSHLCRTGSLESRRPEDNFAQGHLSLDTSTQVPFLSNLFTPLLCPTHLILSLSHTMEIRIECFAPTAHPSYGPLVNVMES